MRSWRAAVGLLLVAAVTPGCGSGAGAPPRTARLDTLAGLALLSPRARVDSVLAARGVSLRCDPPEADPTDSEALVEYRCVPAAPGGGGLRQLAFEEGVLVEIEGALSPGPGRLRARLAPYGEPAEVRYEPAVAARFWGRWEGEGVMLMVSCPDTLDARGCEALAVSEGFGWGRVAP